VKKNPIEEKDERLQKENQLKMNSDGVGSSALKIFIYVLIVVLVIAILYFITLQDTNTFKILN